MNEKKLNQLLIAIDYQLPHFRVRMGVCRCCQVHLARSDLECLACLKKRLTEIVGVRLAKRYIDNRLHGRELQKSMINIADEKDIIEMLAAIK